MPFDPWQSMLDAVEEGIYETVTLRTVTETGERNPNTGRRAEVVVDQTVKANRLPVRTIPGPGAGKEREWPFVIHAVSAAGVALATPPREGHRIVLDIGTPGELVLNIVTSDPENGGKSYRVVCRRVMDKR